MGVHKREHTQHDVSERARGQSSKEIFELARNSETIFMPMLPGRPGKVWTPGAPPPPPLSYPLALLPSLCPSPLTACDK